jgi:hypothetical protein
LSTAFPTPKQKTIFPDTDQSLQTIITVIVRQLATLMFILSFMTPHEASKRKTDEKLHSIFREFREFFHPNRNRFSPLQAEY